MGKKIEQENRKKLAIANACRMYLNLNGFISETENNKIHNRLMKYRDRNEVSISNEQLCSVDFTYDDNV